MKLCCIANPNSPHTKRWLSALNSIGYEISLIGNQVPKYPVDNHINFIDLTSLTTIPKYQYFRWILEVKKFIKYTRPDIVHALGASGAGWLARYSGHTPYLMTVMGSDINLLNGRSIFHQYLTKTALEKATLVVCVSKDLAMKVQNLGIDSEKLRVQTFGIDTLLFSPSNNKKKVKREIGFSDNQIVLSIRAIQEIYNPLIIAKAIPRILENLPETKFIILNYNQDARLLEEFQSILESHKVMNSAFFINEIQDDDQLCKYYQAADLGISIASSDGTPMSVLECMSCGTPIIASELPSLEEWIINNHSGMLVSPLDVENLARQIILLLSNPRLIQSMGNNARKTIIQDADLHEWINQTEEIYDSIL